VQRHVAQRAQRRARREDEAVVDVAQARAGHRHVDRERKHVEARGLGARDQLGAGVAVGPHVELEPLVGVGRGGRELLGRGGPPRREAGRDAHSLRHPRHRALTLVVEEAREPGRGEGQRQRRRTPEDRRGGVDRGDVAQSRRDELDARERLARAAQADLGVGGAVRVVEDGTRGAPTRDRAQVADARRAREAPLGRVELRPSRREQGTQLRPSGQAALGHGGGP
jgi:hypothetical protein